MKGGSEFSLEVRVVAQKRGPSLAVNPILLAESVRHGLESYRTELNGNTAELLSLRARIARHFRYELSE